MGVIRFVRAHVDALLALLLTGAYLLEVYLADASVAGEPLVAGLEADEIVALAAGAGFLLSLALRSRMPVVPVAVAIVAFTLMGRGELETLTSLVVGLVVAAYSVGAWSGGRASAIGALALGLLTGLMVLRGGSAPLEAREVAGPVLVLWAPWVVGLAVRRLRVARGDRRVAGAWSPDGRFGALDADREEAVRELRELIERAMSSVIMHSREARRALRDDPRVTDHSLAVIEAASTEALEETQRLTGLLLSPDGLLLTTGGPGLADIDFLAQEVTKAGLPVATRVEGRPLPLTPDLDAVAYRVVHEALMATLEGARDAKSEVVIRYEPDELQVEVVDDGVAVDGDAAQETAGLTEARQQVAALGGTLDAGPGDGRGYWVLARLPYEPDWS